MAMVCDDLSGCSYCGVETAPDVSLKMLTSQYWIQKIKNACCKVMSQEEIQEFNRKAQEKLRDQGLYDMQRYHNEERYARTKQDWITVEELKSKVYRYQVPEAITYANGEETINEFWLKALQNTNVKQLKVEEIPIRYGICVRRGSIRAFPIEESVFAERNDCSTDELQMSEILFNDPVVVLRESKDANWYFIQTNYYLGWVKVNCIAISSNYEQWMRMWNFDDFLVVTADKIFLEYDPLRPKVSMLEITMGSRLRLVEERAHVGYIGCRAAINNYVVWIPVRDDDGMLYAVQVYLPISRDVSRGYLSYTLVDCINQAFKMLGNIYGWGGMYHSRDCSGLIFAVYRCFGFCMARDAVNQARLPGKICDMSKMTCLQKQKILSTLMPGTLLYFPGHIMMYLGEENNHYYVINSMGTFQIPSESGEWRIRRVHSVIVNDLNVRRKNGCTWLESITKANTIS